MELSERLLDVITDASRGVEHGRITFYLSPEKRTLDWSVETTHKIPIDRPELPRTCRVTARPRKT